MRDEVAPRVYVETTVWNFVFAQDAPEHRDATQRFFDQVRAGGFEVYVAKVVLDEVAAAPAPRRSELAQLISEIAPAVLESSAEAETLAAELVALGMVPPKYANDALHIAIAVVENMDLLVSWNFRHIVRVKTRRVVGAAARLGGYRELEICTPEEVIDETGE
ncbi:MAG: PIN domain-containing protein [Deltaproteobacteria bacterium]|nr:PIN domain-containing protein [Deltaproteobacteria bacterium]